MKLIAIILLISAICFCYLRLQSNPIKQNVKPDVGPLVHQGDRFSVAKDINVGGLTIWGMPYTGSFECKLTAGTILVAKRDATPWKDGFSVVPENYKELEKQLVPEADRSAKKYGGYYFVFLKSDIGKILIPNSK